VVKEVEVNSIAIAIGDRSMETLSKADRDLLIENLATSKGKLPVFLNIT
jgi:hypothetical protein